MGLLVWFDWFGVGQARAQLATAPPPKRVHVQVYAAKNLSEVERLALEQALVRGVGSVGKPRVTAGDPAAKPAGTASEAAAALTDADKQLSGARAKVRQLELDKALTLLQSAAANYSLYLHKLIARDGNANALVDTFVQIATVQFLNGKEEAASKALLRAFVLDPKLTYSPKRFPPQIQELVMQERALFTSAGRGSAKVTVSGTGELYINGIKRPPAPLSVGDLPSGPNVVTLVARGAKPAMKLVQVRANKTTEIAIEVASPPSRVRGPFAGTRDEVGEATPGKRLRRAADKVGAEALLLAIPTISDEKSQLVVYVYDLRSASRAGRFDTTGLLEELHDKAEKLAAEAMRSARWRAAVELAEPTAPLWKRLYRHKYFWHAVGAATGVMLLSVAVASSGGLSPARRVVLFPGLVNF